MAAVKKKPEETNLDPPANERSLRHNAEEQLTCIPKPSAGLKKQSLEQLVHELQVHQIELEMQAEELRRAHLELEESRDKYLDLYEFAPLGYLTLNNKALISQANLSAAVLLGIDRSTLINARFRPLIVSEDLEIWDHFFINLLKSEKKLTATLMLKRGDKATFHGRLEGIRLKTDGNDPLIRMAISDITDIRQAERARRDSEQLLKTVIELLPVGVIILDEDCKVVVINPEMEQIWGSSHSLRIGQIPDYKGWRLEDGARINAHDQAWARAIKKGETTLEEQIEIESSRGVHKVVLNSALPIWRSDGVSGGAVLVTQDITEGKVAEERIQWLASFPELNPDPIIELDMEGTLTYANPATRTILNGLKLTDDPAHFIAWDRAEIINLLMNSKEGRIYREISLRHECFSEEIILDTGLQVVRVYARNITERKVAELQQEHLISELARKNAELDRFAYTVSHDLKSPLIGMQGFLSLLEMDMKSENSDRVQADILRITESAEKLERLINTLLALSRSGKSVDTPVQIPFADIVTDAVRLLDATLRQRGVTRVIPDTMPVISGDRQRLVQVMTNLLDNAVKFMGDQKEPCIEIGVQEDSKTPVFFVKDNGMGIKKDEQTKVFGLYERFNPDIPDSGIGLATVKRIIEAHGGKIWVESEGEGKGTTVCFTLPGVTGGTSNPCVS
jgi:PAS domain S-box-containing protein